MVLHAVTAHGHALEYAADELKDDEEIALAAVRQDGNSLQFCSEALRGSRDVALAAVVQTGGAVRWAGPALLADKGFILAALSVCPHALAYASAELQHDTVLAEVALRGESAGFDGHAVDGHGGEGVHGVDVPQAMLDLAEEHQRVLAEEARRAYDCEQRSARPVTARDRETMLAALAQSSLAVGAWGREEGGREGAKTERKVASFDLVQSLLMLTRSPHFTCRLKNNNKIAAPVRGTGAPQRPRDCARGGGEGRARAGVRERRAPRRPRDRGGGAQELAVRAAVGLRGHPRGRRRCLLRAQVRRARRRVRVPNPHELDGRYRITAAGHGPEGNGGRRRTSVYLFVFPIFSSAV